MNTQRLLKIREKEIKIKAICFHNTMKDFKPPIGKTGTIKETPFQAELKLKIGAKLMLTYNVDTSDGLTNGAIGTLMGVVTNEAEQITNLIIKFENPLHGERKRGARPDLSNRYPNGTAIEKVSFPFSLSKSNKGGIATAKVIQFPVKLAFAATAHKIQGQTVKKPRKVIIDLESVFQPAMAYVMMSRVESIDQLYILEKFNESKIYGSPVAIQQLKKMNKKSVNANPSQWNDLDCFKTKICALNCGSLRHQMEHIKKDDILKNGDVICFPETWLWKDENTESLQLEGYKSHHLAVGKGKGISIYFRENKFQHLADVSLEKIQIIKLSRTDLEVIAVYKSPMGNDGTLRDQLQVLIDHRKSTLIFGDFNMCYIDNRNCRTTKHLRTLGFRQLIEDGTHIEGGHIDQAYFRSNNQDAIAEIYSPYYTAKDHDAICISVKGTEKSQGSYI